MCVDYRQLNAHLVPDAYPVPRINHILVKLRQARYISTLDLKHGYWQIPMAKDSRQFTAFIVPGRGLYQWKVMPFGLHSASATFQRALNSVIGADMEPFGIPRKFVCDNGTQFTSRILKEYFHTIGVEIQYTAPYCPQESPTERTNRTVKTMIAQLNEGDRSSWDELLPEIALAINASVSDFPGIVPLS